MKFLIGFLCYAATTISAQSWVALPPMPKSRAVVVTGDHSRLVIANGLGGILEKRGDSAWKDVSVVGATRVTAVGNQTVFVDRDGLYYNPDGKGLRKASFTDSSANLHFSADGRNIVAAQVHFNPTYSELALSRDSAIATPITASPSHGAVWHGWRRLRYPRTGSLDWPSSSKVWISGGLVVATTYDQTLISRDTGTTWTDSLPFQTRFAALRGDTLALDVYGESALHTSLDGGRTWKKTPAWGYGHGPLTLCGGRLFMEMSRVDTIPDLLSSADLGITWDTLFRGVTNQGQVVWDGRWFWSRRMNELVRFAADSREIVPADSLVAPLGEVTRIVPFGKSLLVLQQSTLSQFSLEPGRLWSYTNGIWKVVRDSVADVAAMAIPSGWKIFVLTQRNHRWAYSWRASHRLDATTDLLSWEIPPFAPMTERIGYDTTGLLFGDAAGMLVIPPNGQSMRLPSWSSGDDHGWIQDLALEGKNPVWVKRGGLFRRNPDSAKAEVLFSSDWIGSYTNNGMGLGVLCASAGGRKVLNGKVVNYPIMMEPSSTCGSARYRGDSLIVWGKPYDFHIVGKENALVWKQGPSNARVARAAWVPRESVKPGSFGSDSVLIVADLLGRLHSPEGLGPSSIQKAAPGIEVSARPVQGGIQLDLPENVDVSVTLFDWNGRTRSVAWSGSLERGVHLIPVGKNATGQFAVVSVGGRSIKSFLVPPTGE